MTFRLSGQRSDDARKWFIFPAAYTELRAAMQGQPRTELEN